MTGAAIGLALTVAICWIGAHAPGPTRAVKLLMFIAFPVALIVTLYAARTFINSADYEPLAGKIWFFGYQATVALFVALVATILPKLMKRD